uniref:Uncharacterized protein n=1 Tax=Nelumbo nucifera TaxID=4432 RepID=A0A822XMN2_NELNU|nr:TPA_asm: hypothetical protein HUJ06_022765 [Nelumbo nucifera]
MIWVFSFVLFLLNQPIKTRDLSFLSLVASLPLSLLLLVDFSPPCPIVFVFSVLRNKIGKEREKSYLDLCEHEERGSREKRTSWRFFKMVNRRSTVNSTYGTSNG